MAFTLPPLPYPYDALVKSIDAQTMEIHHGKHHNAYVTNLNNAIAGTDLESKDLVTLIKDIKALPADKQTAVRNNGGGHWNHDFFWNILSPKGGGEPVGKLADAIKATFGSYQAWKDDFAKTSAGRFGSGWGWLILKDGKLHNISTPNQDNPLMDVADVQGAPILGIDVWEHAYYLRYQNRRPDYITAFFDVVDWEKANAHFEAAH
jgi:Fe-Mn family superoxide dismutase